MEMSGASGWSKPSTPWLVVLLGTSLLRCAASSVSAASLGRAGGLLAGRGGGCRTRGVGDDDGLHDSLGLPDHSAYLDRTGHVTWYREL